MANVSGYGANQFSLHNAKLAMALVGKDRHYYFKTIQRRHLNRTAARYFQRKDAEDLIEEVIQKTPSTITAVRKKLPFEFPEKIAQSIFQGLQQSADLLAHMPKE